MEKTNKIEKININCATKIEQLNQMYDLLHEFEDKYGKYKHMTPTEENVFNTLYNLCDKEELNIVEAEKKVEEFFKDKLGKYWKMRISVISILRLFPLDLSMVFRQMRIWSLMFVFCQTHFMWTH